MQLKPSQQIPPPIPTKPQLHSARCHDAYNGARVLPLAIWVRRPVPAAVHNDEYDGTPPPCYEVVLYYDHNRACTLRRTWDDFRRLRRGLSPWRGAASVTSPRDVAGMRRFLRQALAKRPRECGLEYFLRRRMGDCGGR